MSNTVKLTKTGYYDILVHMNYVKNLTYLSDQIKLIKFSEEHSNIIDQGEKLNFYITKGDWTYTARMWKSVRNKKLMVESFNRT